VKTGQWSAIFRSLETAALLFLVAAPSCGHAQNSSLYHAREYRALITDQRATRVGDSLVVLVYESATATNQTNVKVNKETSIDVSATDHNNSIGGGLNTGSDAEGGGIERRSGEVVARVSATVLEITPNGDYLIAGKQRIALNNETQTITVAGRVRPQDIDANNAIISSRIADANIQFIGHGLLSSREKPGLITQFFNWFF
jgi:flagellar L-ring protein precursor FlgH